MIKPIKRPLVASEEGRKKRVKKERKVGKAMQKLLGDYSPSFILKQGGIICAMLFGLYFIVTLAIDSYNYAVNEKGVDNIPVIDASVDEIKFVPEDRGGLEIKNLDVNVYDVAVDRKDNKNVKQELAELKRDTIKPIAPEKAIKLESEENGKDVVEISEVAFDDSTIKVAKLDSVLKEQNKVKNNSGSQQNNTDKLKQKVAKGLDGINDTLEDLASGEVMVKAESIKSDTLNKNTNVDSKAKVSEGGVVDLAKKEGDIKTTKKAADKSAIPNEKSVDVDEYSEKKIASNPIYRVQFASLRTKRNVEQYWNGLLVNHPELFKAQPYIVEEIKVGTRGTFYRLKVGEFGTGEEAKAFCEGYVAEAKKSKDSCLVVKSY